MRVVAVALVIVLACGETDAAPSRPRPIDRAALALQVALDRAGVSPGMVDGRLGPQTREALLLFQEAHKLPVTGLLDEATRVALRLDDGLVTTTYRITSQDVAGPFVPRIPEDLMQQGRLDALSYTSAIELLAERFHTSERALRQLNLKARFTEAESIEVPDVVPTLLPEETKRRDGPGEEAGRVDRIVVSRSPSVAVVMDASGALLFAAPVTSGSDYDPLPIGEWKVTGVYLRPVFHYNPALFWDADPSHAKTTIKPGPNSPVGAAWIDIDREHYGLHGTPEPRSVGRSSSHGCVRLTNWDVVRLLAFVKSGTRVVFSERLLLSPETVDPPTDEVLELRHRNLDVPVQGVSVDRLLPTFHQKRSGHEHEALDILAPRGTPVVAVEDGTIAKLFASKPGGTTIYQFDPSERFAYYYAHLDRYAGGLKEGATVSRGQVLGYVGSTGNADRAHPHLHFAIFRLGPERHWWEGTPVDPYPVYRHGDPVDLP